MGTVITGHLAIEEAGMGLRQGMERLSDVPSDIVEVHELLKSLGKSHVLATYLKCCTRLAYCSGPDWVTDIVSDLVPQLNAFSYVLCMEKDRMTHTFRIFVEAYAMTITSSGYEDLTLPSIFLFPGFHLMRIIGQHFLWSWLPEPKLYSIQVRVEIQYRKAQLIDELEATLERIDANFPASQSFQDSSSQRQCLETAINKLTIHQQSVRRVIDGSNPSFWRWTRESEETVKLGRYYRMGESVLSHLFAVMQTINEYKMYSRSLRGGLQVLRQSFERLPLARNLLAVPPPLLTQVRKISLLARGQSSRTDEGGDSRDITHIVSRYGASLYDLNPIDKARLSSLRSEVAQVCKAGNYMKMGCDDLFSICTIYHLGVIRSVLGNDLLSDYPTSWAVVREKAMHRWEQRTRT